MSRSLREQSLPRFALRREEAAASLSVSAGTFDGWVEDGRMPKPYKPNGGVALWDVDEIRACWQAMKDGTVLDNPLDRLVL
ncbi:helix-turn-helix transcriptional regulator [Hansschlegelia quercus]|uniref:AlpA family phage regulatory protein n=1 Tax=Hansschlegelia quercus TaxID=2528245 RepID=A0A4Q9GK29_9HYPH|nr:hypothetical protein [Hansschlegelia quercus]TBN54709.1 hypothetical protein EYR15_00635 [Hansschlegelia quercus]